MDHVLQQTTGRIYPVLDTLLEGVRVVFRSVSLADGSVTMLAPLPTAAADLAAVQRGVDLSRGRLAIRPVPPVFGGVIPEFLRPGTVAPAPPPPVPVVVPPPPAERVPAPIWAARQRGWTDADLAGTAAAGDFGEAGGRSPRSGLTAAEMALSDPPPGWGAAAEAGKRAWEVTGWVPPGLQWTPAPKPAPAPEPELEPDRAGEVVPGTISNPAAYAEALADGRLVEIVGGAPTPAPGLSDEETAELDAYPDLAAALDEIVGLRARAGGALPSYHKARYHLAQRAGLPSPRASQYEAMIHQLRLAGRLPAATT